MTDDIVGIRPVNRSPDGSGSEEPGARVRSMFRNCDLTDPVMKRLFEECIARLSEGASRE